MTAAIIPFPQPQRKEVNVIAFPACPRPSAAGLSLRDVADRILWTGKSRDLPRLSSVPIIGVVPNIREV